MGNRTDWFGNVESVVSGTFHLVAVDNNLIVGFGDIDKTGYLDRLYIHSDYQRQGIAAAICDQLEQGSSRNYRHPCLYHS